VRPSLVDIRCALTVATVLADEFVQLHPEHAEAVTHFLTKIHRSCAELRDSISDKELPEQEGHDGTDTR
jgi:ABC-type Zn uptake system ZnuABC Zn-binding protein ZnuA